MTTTPQTALLTPEESIDMARVFSNTNEYEHGLVVSMTFNRSHLLEFVGAIEQAVIAKLQATQEPVQPPSQQIRICMQIQGGETHSTFAEYMGGDIGYLTFVRREWLPEAPGQQAEPVQAGELPDEREAFEAYMSDNGKWPAAVQRYDNGARGYVLLQTSTAWGIWQARAALSARKPLTLTEIDGLAKVYAKTYSSPHHFSIDCEGIRKIINGIGLEVKHG